MVHSSRFLMIAVMFLCAALSTAVQAQFEVYVTYDSYSSGSASASYPDYQYDSDKKGMLNIENGSKEKKSIDLASIWGFKYKDQLFRVVKDGKYLSESKPVPVMLMKQVSGAFFWQGGDQLFTLKKDQSLFRVTVGYLSSSIEGDLALMPVVKNGEVQKGGDAFFADNKDLAWLHKCVMSKSRKYLNAAVEICIKRMEMYPDTMK